MQLAAATRSTSKLRRPVGRAPGGDIDRLPVVAVVDDEDAVREAIEGLLRSAGFEAEGFGSAEAFLSSRRRTRFSRMILDIGLPGMSGLDLQQRLIASGTSAPIVFITRVRRRGRPHAGAGSRMRRRWILPQAVRRRSAAEHHPLHA